MKSQLPLICLFVFVGCSTFNESKEVITPKNSQVSQQTTQNTTPQVATRSKINQKVISQNANVQQSSNGEYVEETPDVTNIDKEMKIYESQFENLKPIDKTAKANKQVIQLCLLLDTSNSMDGLINQAKAQLWEIVNELAKSKKDNKDIVFEVALYEYGNARLQKSEGYIRQVTSFTNDLDKLSEFLFALKTNGGDEYCGHVIASALNKLQWNPDPESLKIIYIAGNEPFNQGGINFKVPCAISAKRDIIVNTIHCGSHDQGLSDSWQLGAKLGKGQFFCIDSNQIVEDIPTPFDDQILNLNVEINKTYLYYGQEGSVSYQRQTVQDENAKSVSKSNSVKRAGSKGSNLYTNMQWDLVDAISEKDFNIDKIDKKTLPKELQNKSNEEILKHIQIKKEERLVIQKQIGALTLKRIEFIKNKKDTSSEDKSLGSAIIKSLRVQAESKKFIFN